MGAGKRAATAALYGTGVSTGTFAITEGGATGEICTLSAGSIGIGLGAVVVLAAGRGKAGIQGGSGTEVQAASKVNGATIPSSAERVRPGEVPVRIEESKRGMVVILFWVLTMGQA